MLPDPVKADISSQKNYSHAQKSSIALLQNSKDLGYNSPVGITQYSLSPEDTLSTIGSDCSYSPRSGVP